MLLTMAEFWPEAAPVCEEDPTVPLCEEVAPVCDDVLGVVALVPLCDDGFVVCDPVVEVCDELVLGLVL